MKLILKIYIIQIILFPLIASSADEAKMDTTVFYKTFGGVENDFAYQIQQVSDSGYIIAGQTESFGNGSPMKPDGCVIKLDKKGSAQWIKTYGGEEGDVGFSIEETTDKCFILAGATSSFGKKYPPIWIIKLDWAGDSLWSRIYEGKVVSGAQSVKQTADGGYIFVGKGNENVIKTDSAGKIEWGKHFGWLFYSVQQTKDGGYIAVGDTIYQQQEWNYIPSPYIIKFDSAGITEWSDSAGNGPGRIASVAITQDGGYIAAGDSIHIKSQFEYSRFAMVMKLTFDGRYEWKYFGNEHSDAGSAVQTADGGYVFAGNVLDRENGLDLFVVKLDKNGHEEWKRTFGKPNTWEYASSVQQTFDGGFVVAGQTESTGAGRYDMWILKIDSLGNGPDATSIFSGNWPGNAKIILEQNYPNPFRSLTRIGYKLRESQLISLRIYDSTGKEVATLVDGYQSAGSYTSVWHGHSVPPGVYYYRLQTGSHSEIRKMVCIK